MEEFIEEAIKIERKKWIRYIHNILKQNGSKESMERCLKNLIEMEEEQWKNQ